MLRKLLFTILVILVSGCNSSNCPEPTKTGSNSGVPSGCFDVYVLAETWFPQYCTRRSDYSCDGLKNTWVATNLGAHGLWPQYKEFKGDPSVPTYPTNCTNSPGGSKFIPSDLSSQLKEKYVKLSPIDGLNLANHEWKKHGTCSNMTQQNYFNQVINYVVNKIPTPQSFKFNIGKSVSYQQLVNWYNGAKWVLLRCYYDKDTNKQYLSEIRTFWSKAGVRIENPGLIGSCKENLPIYIRGV